MIELQNGKTPFSQGTYSCENSGCFYNSGDGRCVYNVARLQIRTGRECYEELRQSEIEAEADYALGLL